MRGDEARLLLGFPPTSRVTLSQIKAAYKSKAWEYHPDRVPVQEKPGAESKFKLISEAYNFLLDGARGEGSSAATYTRVVRTGVPSVHKGKSNGALIGIPFLLIVVGTVGIGAHRAYRAYEKEKLAHPSHNPFLP
ncbi:hypothetical protein VitviT2T_009728 [Vitis vinifera]|uniref:J domain-containing protein n=1 Tax=Vitis vinifera TaxID=29760 RepID=A0ABY9C5Q9_VITVI|nr:uncharacterized protein LOC100253760 [Vitis vinifera]XP_059593940.1 uncharacterized protein LOC100253760 [Vitis vinifera]WJZ90596.1 hypothetical protein VitviT2T_009728 [Vitis vinifera]WJZ90597.1 hypothetical protein VitviT2T_009728 [Vitis vinifera]|eukprot:XP_010652342.1 PREDICTED: uncharacterized protein LOC100253760 [Vitis vinifera]